MTTKKTVAWRARFTVAAMATLLCLASGPSAAAQAPLAHGSDHHHGPGHSVLRGAVAAPSAEPGKPLPVMQGTIPLRRSQTIKPGSPTGKTTAGTTAGTTAAAAGGRLALRALVVGVDESDWGVATWRATLDRVGAAYDVLYSRTAPLTAGTLVRPDGVGNYNAILLSSSMLLYDSGGGSFVSGLDGNEWNLLWAYERDYAVRQAVLYTSHGTFPENYCLSASSEGSVGTTPLGATLTPTGAGVFDYLRSTASVPITQSYVYRTRVTAGCAAQPVLTSGADVLGVRTTSTDGRERIALTFTSNQYLMQAHLLTYGLFRWASRGLHLGEHRHFLNVDVDDWFNSADHYFPDGHIESNPGFQMSGHDAFNVNTRQSALRGQYPLASNFTLNMAYNGADANLSAGTACSPNGGISTLTATTRCLSTKFRWLNHTYTHPELNFTNYATSYNEIAANRTVASTLGLSQPNTVLKTGEYSGLGVYNPNPDDDINPPTDFGLAASNPNFLAAARDLGVRYVHGNMSFASHVPACFNCGIFHPLEPSIMVVPDWPTNIAYHTTTPAEQTAFYNSLYGPNGRFPFWPTNLTYQQMLDYEAEVAPSHVATGSLYSHTFHIANLRDYSGGNTLTTDWVGRVLAKYSALYSVPVLNPEWTSLAAYAEARNRHFQQLSGNAGAIYDPAANTITVSSPITGTATVSGSVASGYTSYGSDVASSVSLTAGGSTTVPARPRS